MRASGVCVGCCSRGCCFACGVLWLWLELELRCAEGKRALCFARGWALRCCEAGPAQRHFLSLVGALALSPCPTLPHCRALDVAAARPLRGRWRAVAQAAEAAARRGMRAQFFRWSGQRSTHDPSPSPPHRRRYPHTMVPALGQPPGVRLRSVCVCVCVWVGGGGGGGVCVWGDLVWQQRGDSGIHHNRWGVGWKFDLLGSLDGPSWRTKHYDKLAAFYCSLLKFALATQLYNQFLFSKNPKLGVLKYHVPPHDLSLSQSGRISMAHRARALVQRRRAPVQTNHGPPPRWRPRTPTCEQPRTRPRSSDASIPG